MLTHLDPKSAEKLKSLQSPNALAEAKDLEPVRPISNSDGSFEAQRIDTLVSKLANFPTAPRQSNLRVNFHQFFFKCRTWCNDTKILWEELAEINVQSEWFYNVLACNHPTVSMDEDTYQMYIRAFGEAAPSVYDFKVFLEAMLFDTEVYEAKTERKRLGLKFDKYQAYKKQQWDECQKAGRSQWADLSDVPFENHDVYNLVRTGKIILSHHSHYVHKSRHYFAFYPKTLQNNKLEIFIGDINFIRSENRENK